MNLDLWKWENICKGRGIKIKIEWEQVQLCSLCVILTATIGMDGCGGDCILDIINKTIIKNAADGRTRIKEYPTDGSWNFWLI